MNIVKIDKDTVKEVRETIIDLKKIKSDISNIDTMIEDAKNLPDMVANEEKLFEIRRLETQKKELEDLLNSYK